MVLEKNKAREHRRAGGDVSPLGRRDLLAIAAAVPTLSGTVAARSRSSSDTLASPELVDIYGFGGTAVLDRTVSDAKTNVLEDARLLDVNGSQVASLDEDDSDWYTLDLTADHRLTLNIRQWFSSGLLGMILYDSNGELLTLVYDTGQQPTSLVHTVTESGQYYVEIIDLDDGHGAYRLRTDTKRESDATVVQNPHDDEPWILPGRIEAENFDDGGHGVAYNDMTDRNQGSVYRRDENVDIARTGNSSGYAVFDMDDGEWLEYTVNVESGVYDIKIRVTGGTDESGLAVSLDRQRLGTIDARTDQMGNWRTKTLEEVSVSADGTATLRVTVKNGDFAFNWIDFVQRDDSTSISDESDSEYGIQAYGEYGYGGISA
ncbi:carbohydrate-binding domain-containing protein [Halomontanus rarus]|uniref:carbohydrate-binding domain-containing protein n=1 Tax=Halomontanus rarus TaxID=3034020 RepID=UPI0023E8C825|nr:carbohydrate-binding domain-containing protein [Halovivax sp. TS33]